VNEDTQDAFYLSDKQKTGIFVFEILSGSVTSQYLALQCDIIGTFVTWRYHKVHRLGLKRIGTIGVFVTKFTTIQGHRRLNNVGGSHVSG